MCVHSIMKYMLTGGSLSEEFKVTLLYFVLLENTSSLSSFQGVRCF